MPGKELVEADTLSRSPMQHSKADEAVADEVEAYINMIESGRTVTERRLILLQEATARDENLQRAMTYTQQVWPERVPANLSGFRAAQSELSVSNGLLIYQNRVVIPESQQKEILEKLHESHQGLTKCRDNAKQTVWWPGLRADMSHIVENCQTCRENRPTQRSEPLKPTNLPQRPWKKLGSDIFKFKGRDYLVIVDYYSRWIEVKCLSSMNSATLINKLKQLFSQQGIPEILVSDNGPRYASSEFARFAKDNGFIHHTTSPYFPQANGESERAVQTVKKMMQHSDPDIAMLNYRNMPHSATGISPSVALMGRQLRTMIPVIPQNLKPVKVSKRLVHNCDDSAKQKEGF